MEIFNDLLKNIEEPFNNLLKSLKFNTSTYIEAPQGTSKYLEKPKCNYRSTSKYLLKAPQSTWRYLKYLKIPQSTWKYPKVPKSTNNYLNVPKSI